MKNKSLLLILLFFLICFGACIATAKAEPPEPTAQEFEDTTTLLAQDYPQPTPQNYQQPQYNIQSDAPIDNRTSLVGFVVLSVMGLIGFVIKSDRATMNNLVASIKENSSAVVQQAIATEKLSERLENRIEQIQADTKTRLENLEKLMIRIEKQ